MPYDGDWKKADALCPYCGKDEWYYILWDSSDGAYTDEKNECRACKEIWWVDGPDY